MLTLRPGALATRVMWRTSPKVLGTAFLGTLLMTDQVASADIISTVEFDQTGDYLATGDKGGRVVLFERNESVGSPSIQTRAGQRLTTCPSSVEEDLRIQVSHRIPVP
jgi:hypothetical protein